MKRGAKLRHPRFIWGWTKADLYDIIQNCMSMLRGDSMRIDVLGVGFDNLTMDEVVERGMYLLRSEGA